MEAAVEAVSSSVLETQRAMEEVSKQIRHTTSLVDAIGYVLQECGGDYVKMRKFFKYWNAQPLSKSHPYEAEPRLRVRVRAAKGLQQRDRPVPLPPYRPGW